MQRKEKIKVNLTKMIGFSLLLIGIIFNLYCILNSYIQKTLDDDNIESYIKNYNNKGNQVNNTKLEKSNSNFKTKYVAILNIPKINLKKGLVMVTKNFKSINYSISIDKNSKFPNEQGNFILYAHAGNSKISYFKNLDKLESNDEALVYYLDKIYSYKVIKKYEIEKTGYFSLNEQYSSHNLILITCVHKTNKQLIIICALEKIY